MQPSADIGPQSGSTAGRLAMVALTTLMLLWPVAFNGGVILYPDTFAYVDNGADAVYGLRDLLFGNPDTAAPANAPWQAVGGRSPFYGLLGFFSWRLGGFAVASFVQALWAATALILILTRFGINRPHEQLLVAASMALFTSLGFFAGTLLPDVFVGIALAALGMLLAFGSALTRQEAVFWLLTLAFACTTHNAILLTVGVVFAVVSLATWPRRGRGQLLAIGAVAVAVIAGAAAKPFMARVTGAEVVSVPFLLARSVSDGPAARLLKEDCPAAGYASCRYVPYFPLDEADVLWGGTPPQIAGLPPFVSWSRLPPAERGAVSAEANTIVLAAVKRYPVEQVVASARNSAAQLVDLGLERFGWPLLYKQAAALTDNSIFAAEGEKYRQTRIWAETYPLRQLSQFWLSIYLAATGAIVLMLAMARRQGAAIDRATGMFVATVLTGVVVNAAVNASLSSIVGRYQSRVSWLVLLSAILLAHALRRARGQPRAG